MNDVRVGLAIEEQHGRWLYIAGRCPVHVTLRAGDTPGTRGHQPDEPKSTFSAEDVKVRPLAAGVAVLNFRLVQHEGGKVNHFRNSGTFVKRSGRWQVVSWQATRVVAAPAQ